MHSVLFCCDRTNWWPYNNSGKVNAVVFHDFFAACLCVCVAIWPRLHDMRFNDFKDFLVFFAGTMFQHFQPEIWIHWWVVKFLLDFIARTMRVGSRHIGKWFQSFHFLADFEYFKCAPNICLHQIHQRYVEADIGRSMNDNVNFIADFLDIFITHAHF